MTPRIVVMGVCGCGKSTLAAALAEALALPFVEGDDCHPPANVAKMAAGIPLTDDDRAPFLQAVAAALAAPPHGAVASCSALKRVYRDRLRAGAGDLMFVLPVLDEPTLARRLRARPGHFMPPALLASQLATFEPLEPDERGVRIDGTLPLARQVGAASTALRGAPPRPR